MHNSVKYFLKQLDFGPRGHSLDPPPPGWTSVDSWLTPPPPLLVHVVAECPPTENLSDTIAQTKQEGMLQK